MLFTKYTSQTSSFERPVLSLGIKFSQSSPDDSNAENWDSEHWTRNQDTHIDFPAWQPPGAPLFPVQTVQWWGVRSQNTWFWSQLWHYPLCDPISWISSFFIHEKRSLILPLLALHAGCIVMAYLYKYMNINALLLLLWIEPLDSLVPKRACLFYESYMSLNTPFPGGLASCLSPLWECFRSFGSLPFNHPSQNTPAIWRKKRELGDLGHDKRLGDRVW